ncbi:MAG: hypothetical protein ACRES5_18980 [Pseudomonas sp.]
MDYRNSGIRLRNKLQNMGDIYYGHSRSFCGLYALHCLDHLVFRYMGRIAGKALPGNGGCSNLAGAAQTALHFSDAASRELRPVIEPMVDQDASQRLISLLVVLNKLAQDANAKKIAAARIPDASSQITEDAWKPPLTYLEIN